MPSSTNKLTFELAYTTNKASLDRAQKELQKIVEMSAVQPRIEAARGNKGAADYVKRLDSAQAHAKELQGALNKAWDSDLGVMNFKKLNKELSKMDLKEVRKEFLALGETGQKAWNQIVNECTRANTQFTRMETALDKIFTSIKNVFTYNISQGIYSTIVGEFGQAVKYTKELDSTLNNIRVVTGQTSAQMEDFSKSAQQAAKSLSVSTKDIAKGSLIYFQQGDTTEDALAKAETTQKLVNVSGGALTAETASSYATSIWQGYQAGNRAIKEGMEVYEEYLDKISLLANKSASSVSEIANAMGKVASTANTMGISYDQLGAQIATIREVTQQAPESIGTALRTIYSRLGDLKLGGTDEEGANLGLVSGAVSKLGIQILDANGELRNMGTVIDEIGAKWQTLSKAQQIALAKQMGGTRQINVVTALFDNYNRYSELLNITENESAGALDRMQKTWEESLEAMQSKAEAAREELHSALLDPEFLQSYYTSLKGIFEFLGNIVEGMGGGLGVLSTFSGIFLQIFSNKIALEVQKMATNIRGFFENLGSNTIGLRDLSKSFSDVSQDSEKIKNNLLQLNQYAHLMTEEEKNRIEELKKEADIIIEQERKYEEMKQHAESLKGIDINVSNLGSGEGLDFTFDVRKFAASTFTPEELNLTDLAPLLNTERLKDMGVDEKLSSLFEESGGSLEVFIEKLKLVEQTDWFKELKMAIEIVGSDFNQNNEKIKQGIDEVTKKYKQGSSEIAKGLNFKNTVKSLVGLVGAANTFSASLESIDTLYQRIAEDGDWSFGTITQAIWAAVQAGTSLGAALKNFQNLYNLKTINIGDFFGGKNNKKEAEETIKETIENAAKGAEKVAEESGKKITNKLLNTQNLKQKEKEAKDNLRAKIKEMNPSLEGTSPNEIAQRYMAQSRGSTRIKSGTFAESFQIGLESTTEGKQKSAEIKKLADEAVKAEQAVDAAKAGTVATTEALTAAEIAETAATEAGTIADAEATAVQEAQNVSKEKEQVSRLAVVAATVKETVAKIALKAVEILLNPAVGLTIAALTAAGAAYMFVTRRAEAYRQAQEKLNREAEKAEATAANQRLEETKERLSDIIEKIDNLQDKLEKYGLTKAEEDHLNNLKERRKELEKIIEYQEKAAESADLAASVGELVGTRNMKLDIGNAGEKAAAAAQDLPNLSINLFTENPEEILKWSDAYYKENQGNFTSSQIKHFNKNYLNKDFMAIESIAAGNIAGAGQWSPEGVETYTNLLKEMIHVDEETGKATKISKNEFDKISQGIRGNAKYVYQAAFENAEDYANTLNKQLEDDKKRASQSYTSFFDQAILKNIKEREDWTLEEADIKGLSPSNKAKLWQQSQREYKEEYGRTLDLANDDDIKSLEAYITQKLKSEILGDLQGSIEYIQKAYNLSYEEAVKLAEKWQEMGKTDPFAKGATTLKGILAEFKDIEKEETIFQSIQSKFNQSGDKPITLTLEELEAFSDSPILQGLYELGEDGRLTKKTDKSGNAVADNFSSLKDFKLNQLDSTNDYLEQIVDKMTGDDKGPVTSKYSGGGFSFDDKDQLVYTPPGMGTRTRIASQFAFDDMVSQFLNWKDTSGNNISSKIFEEAGQEDFYNLLQEYQGTNDEKKKTELQKQIIDAMSAAKKALSENSAAIEALINSNYYDDRELRQSQEETADKQEQFYEKERSFFKPWETNKINESYQNQINVRKSNQANKEADVDAAYTEWAKKRDSANESTTRNINITSGTIEQLIEAGKLTQEEVEAYRAYQDKVREAREYQMETTQLEEEAAENLKNQAIESINQIGEALDHQLSILRKRMQLLNVTDASAKKGLASEIGSALRERQANSQELADYYWAQYAKTGNPEDKKNAWAAEDAVEGYNVELKENAKVASDATKALADFNKSQRQLETDMAKASAEHAMKMYAGTSDEFQIQRDTLRDINDRINPQRINDLEEYRASLQQALSEAADPEQAQSIQEALASTQKEIWAIQEETLENTKKIYQTYYDEIDRDAKSRNLELDSRAEQNRHNKAMLGTRDYQGIYQNLAENGIILSEQYDTDKITLERLEAIDTSEMNEQQLLDHQERILNQRKKLNQDQENLLKNEQAIIDNSKARIDYEYDRGMKRIQAEKDLFEHTKNMRVGETTAAQEYQDALQDIVFQEAERQEKFNQLEQYRGEYFEAVKNKDKQRMQDTLDLIEDTEREYNKLGYAIEEAQKKAHYNFLKGVQEEQIEAINTMKSLLEDYFNQYLKDLKKPIEQEERNLKREKRIWDKRKKNLDLIKEALSDYTEALERQWAEEDQREERKKQLEEREDLSEQRTATLTAAASGDLAALAQVQDLDEQLKETDEDIQQSILEDIRDGFKQYIEDQEKAIDDLIKRMDRWFDKWQERIDDQNYTLDELEYAMTQFKQNPQLMEQFRNLLVNDPLGALQLLKDQGLLRGELNAATADDALQLIYKYGLDAIDRGTIIEDAGFDEFMTKINPYNKDVQDALQGFNSQVDTTTRALKNLAEVIEQLTGKSSSIEDTKSTGEIEGFSLAGKFAIGILSRFLDNSDMKLAETEALEAYTEGRTTMDKAGKAAQETAATINNVTIGSGLTVNGNIIGFDEIRKGLIDEAIEQMVKVISGDFSKNGV